VSPHKLLCKGNDDEEGCKGSRDDDCLQYTASAHFPFTIAAVTASGGPHDAACPIARLRSSLRISLLWRRIFLVGYGRVERIGGANRMKRIACAVACLWLAFAVACDAAVVDGGRDIAAIQAVEVAQATAWNHHDAKAYATLFSPNADVVNVLGWWWKSRAELEMRLGRAFAGVFRMSTLRIESVDVRFPASDVAVAHVRWTMTGAFSPDGRPDDTPQQGLQTQLLVRTGKRWLIDAFQNTITRPEQPFPLASRHR